MHRSTVHRPSLNLSLQRSKFMGLESWKPVIAFALVLVCTAIALYDVDGDHIRSEKNKALAQASDKGDAVKRVIDRTLSAALALGALVVQSDGEIPSFEEIGTAMLPLYPGASALQLVPNGVTRRVVPLAGNEKSIGHDLFANPARRKEAELARDSRRMTLAGPFNLVQGGLGAVGRFPVYLNSYNDAESSKFWGFTSVVLRFPDVLKEVQLQELGERGYDFWLWRKHPDTGEIQLIEGSEHPLPKELDRVDHVLDMPNGEWNLSLAPVKGWRNHGELFGLGMLGLLLATLLARLLGEMAKLEVHHENLESVVLERTEQLAQREAELQRAQEMAGMGSWVFDPVSETRILSPNAGVLFGLPSHHPLQLETLLPLVHPDERARVESSWKTALAGESVVLEYRVTPAGQAQRWIFEQIEIQPLATAANQTQMLGTLQDVTVQKASDAIIWKQANTDSLTGLANRHLFLNRLDQAVTRASRNGTRVGLAFLDLDGFKWINDSLGHLEGDELLKIIAQRLEYCVDENDTVARLGGDEFTIIIEDLTNVDALRQFALKVLSVIREPILLGGTMRHQTASIGLTTFPNDGNTVDVLLRNADMAMYHGKRLGKNQYRVYTPAMQDAADRRTSLEAELHEALANQEFALYFQPIVNATSGQITGAEALLRWAHPTKGLVSPQEFIPLAEETGLIVPIGEWVFRKAMSQIQIWANEHPQPLLLSINVSGVQLRQRSFFDLVTTEMATGGHGQNTVQMEITETVLLDSSPVVMEQLKAFCNMGIRMALDDFGTGYASLSYLKTFAFDVLKIDKSFIDDCPDADTSSRLVDGTIRLAHSLGIKVVAEGVETQEQRAFLQSVGCDGLQGYLISRPVEAHAFADLLAAQRQSQNVSST